MILVDDDNDSYDDNDRPSNVVLTRMKGGEVALMKTTRGVENDDVEYEEVKTMMMRKRL